MNEFLLNLSIFSNVVLIFLTLCFFLVVKVFRRHKSLAISLAVASVFELVFFIMRTKLLALPLDREAIRFIWFNSFAAVSSMGVYCIYKIHALYRCTPKSEAKLVASSFIFFSCFELATYIDYSYIGTGSLPMLYQILTPSVGLLVAFKLSWNALVAMYSHIIGSKRQEA